MSAEPTAGTPEAPDAAVTLRFTPVPEHVRTARLVATAVARRIGLVDEQLDAVRLAVGEACARAVQRSESAHGAAAELISLRLTHHPVGDRVHLEAVVVDGAGDDGVETEDVAMLLMEGLADEVVVSAGPGGPGGTTRLVWSPLERGDRPLP
jgi:anti-sigma regulatory factor (Ser/Thr protein kinase)